MADDDDIIGVAMPLEGDPPRCDRCGETSTSRAYMWNPELGTVCMACLTDDEFAQLQQDMADAINAKRN